MKSDHPMNLPESAIFNQTPSQFPIGLMLSGKAAKLLGVQSSKLEKVDDFSEVGHWSACWRCELIIGHKPTKTAYFLCTNAQTLFSFVIPNRDGKVMTLVEDLGDRLMGELHRCRASIPMAVAYGYLLLRGQPRSLIGSQNELVFLASHEMCESERSVESLTKYLNGVPLFAIEDLPEMAFQKAVIQDPPFEVSEGEAAETWN
jgi:hypothetical protein